MLFRFAKSFPSELYDREIRKYCLNVVRNVHIQKQQGRKTLHYTNRVLGQEIGRTGEKESQIIYWSPRSCKLLSLIFIFLFRNVSHKILHTHTDQRYVEETQFSNTVSTRICIWKRIVADR